MTTGELADAVGVACRTVSKWCDSGLLPHHRLPGSGDRRIDRAGAYNALLKKGFPPYKLAAILDRPYCVIVGRGSPDTGAVFRRLDEMSAATGLTPVRVGSPMDLAFWLAAGGRAAVVVIDADTGTDCCNETAAVLRGRPEYTDTPLAAVANEDTAPESLTAFDFAARRPFNPTHLASQITRMAGR
jgi:excisionase family DNA binding protein